MKKGGMAEKFHARRAAVVQPAAWQPVDWRVAGSTLDVNSLHSEVHLNKISSAKCLPEAAR